MRYPKILAAAVAGLVALIALTGLYSTRAVLVPPGTYLVRGPITDNDLSPMAGSSSGLVCFWFASNYVTPPNIASVFFTAQHDGRPLIQFAAVGGIGGPFLEITLVDLHNNSLIATSTTPLLMNNRWHMVGATWDTSTSNYLMQAAVDGHLVGWRPFFKRGRGIHVPYRLATTWTLFADEHEGTGTAFGFFHGRFAHLYFHAADADWGSITQLYRPYPGCAVRGTDGVLRPVSYGPQGDGPMGPIMGPDDYHPILHMTGGIADFRRNQGPGTEFFQRGPLPLQISPDDPWQALWPDDPLPQLPRLVPAETDTPRRMFKCSAVAVC
jgi:hypothetical protein